MTIFTLEAMLHPKPDIYKMKTIYLPVLSGGRLIVFLFLSVTSRCYHQMTYIIQKTENTRYVLHCAARLVTLLRKHDHISPGTNGASLVAS